MNKNNKLTIVNSLLNWIPIVLAGLMPIFFLPITVEYFEFNKLALLSIATAVMLILWCIKIVATKKVIVAKSSLDIPLFGLLAAMILSTVFSINKHTSLFGNQGRWFPSLFGYAILMVFYYVTASNLKKENVTKALYAFLGGSTISTMLSLISYYGIRLADADFLKIQNFSVAGSITTTVLGAIATTVIGFILALNSKNVLVRTLLGLVSIISFYFVLIVGDMPLTALLLLSIVVSALLVGVQKIKKNNVFAAVIAGVMLLVAMSVTLPVTKSLLTSKTYPQRISLSINDSWRIASSTIREFPILGTGPSTFYLNFPRYRSLSMNTSEYWNYRFDKPYSEIFNVISTLGILGAALVLFLAAKVFKTAIESRDSTDSTGISSVLSVLLLLSGASFLLTYATVLNSYILFGFLALTVAYKASGSDEDHSNNEGFSVATLSSLTPTSKNSVVKKEYLHYVAITPLIALAIVGIFLTYRMYVGEYFMRKSLQAAQSNNAKLTYDYQIKAVNSNPRIDSYHTTFAQTNLVLANNLAGKKDLTDEDKKAVQSLVSQAIRSIKVSTEVLNPLNVSAWETRAAIYKAISGVAQDADQWAVGAYTTAIQLDPTNAALRLQLGGIYYAKADYLAAANQFRTAATLKQDYANAYYNFAQSLVKLQDYKNAQKALEQTKLLVDENSADYQKVSAELEDLKRNYPTTPTTDKPTVEEIAGQNKGITTTQEKLKTPAEINTAPTETPVAPTQ